MSTDSIHEFIKNSQLFKNLDDSGIAAVAARLKHREILKNSPVIIAGDSSTTMYLIKAGNVNVIARNDKGKEMILSTLGAGDMIGELSLIDDQPRSADVIANEKCELYALNKADFFELIQQYPQISLQVIRYLCQRVRFTNSIAQSLALMDVYERLKAFLYEMATEQDDGKFVIDRPLTHKEIAARLGSGREIISRILSELIEGDYLKVDKKLITINKKLPKGR
jgi:CRP/FNR family cyclic AMP-dependent transcriptional regulator